MDRQTAHRARPVRRPVARVAILALAALAAAGCRVQERTYPDHPPATVWAAVRAVAQTPDYATVDPADRWNVDRNEVLLDEAGGRLEIHRELSRTHLRTRGDRFVEHRRWKLGVTVSPMGAAVATDDAESAEAAAGPNGTIVRLASRGPSIPMQVHLEAERFFDQVSELLAAPAGLGIEVATEPADASSGS
ncbi:MAG: hypothetical protein ACYTEV_09210 [Planctomycetota bacterium]